MIYVEWNITWCICGNNSGNDQILETHARQCLNQLTHWGRVTHICASKLTIIGSDDGLLPGRRQAIIWTNDGILLIRTFRTQYQWHRKRNSYIFIQENAFQNVVRKMAAILSRPQCVKLETIGELTHHSIWQWRWTHKTWYKTARSQMDA